MKSRGPGGTPRLEPQRRPETEESRASETTTTLRRDELTRRGLRRAFVDQFRLIARRVIPLLKAAFRRAGAALCAPRTSFFQDRPDPSVPAIDLVRGMEQPEAQEQSSTEGCLPPVNHRRRASIFRFILS